MDTFETNTKLRKTQAPDLAPQLLEPTEMRLRLREAGFSPVPLSGKAPPMDEWQKKLETNPDEIALWASLYPYAKNTGIITKFSPAADIDIMHPEAAEAIEALARERFEEHGDILVRIGMAPKRAILLRTDEPFSKITRKFIGPGGSEHKIEILGDGQQLVAHGIHPDTGQAYRWHGGEPGHVRRAELPYVREADILAFLDAAAKILTDKLGFEEEAEEQPKGNGRDKQTSDSQWGKLNEDALQNLSAWVPKIFPTAKRTKKGWYRVASADLGRGFEEDLSLTSQGIKYFGNHDMGDPRGGRRSPIDVVMEWNHLEFPDATDWLEKALKPRDDAGIEEDHPKCRKVDVDNEETEDGIALAFAEQEQNNLRYIPENGRWLIWDKTHWRTDNILAAYRTARILCRKSGARKQKTVAAVVTLAKSDTRLVATMEQFDANPWLLNTENGTNDLKTGVERPANPNDYITKKTGCAIAPKGTPHPLWTAFLNRVMGKDAELIKFLQRYFGYCLTGLTIEHCFVFSYGTGANGKSTLFNTIAKIFGDYATTAAMETFLASNNERHPTDIAKLVGARIVVAQETQQGRKWDEEKIKALTGGDRQTARFMRQDFFDFIPTFKLLISGNHKPNLNTVDEAMRRRFLLVPFTVKIPEKDRDLKLTEKLAAEWPAILRWAVDGCLEWQRIGLAPPAAVLEATKNYFEAEDTLAQWMSEKCDIDLGNEFKYAPIADLFSSWAEFAKAGGDIPGSKKSFSEAMQARGHERGEKGHAKTRVLTGIRFKPPPPPPHETDK
jgi:putative DNA primase/helicase